jgi:hypothetical protein
VPGSAYLHKVDASGVLFQMGNQIQRRTEEFGQKNPKDHAMDHDQSLIPGWIIYESLDASGDPGPKIGHKFAMHELIIWAQWRTQGFFHHRFQANGIALGFFQDQFGMGWFNLAKIRIRGQ